ncbi:MAG: hypothetical protein CMN78_00575 [Spirochaetales bacterium]|nr:hypothetical protein [Spirochaetales bacterium]
MRPGIWLIFLISVISSSYASDGDGFAGWHRADTEHFVFIYEPKDRTAAEQLAGFAEDVYADITGFYDSYPDKIYCVIDGRGDIRNNFFRPQPAHISITVAGPLRPYSPRTDGWLKLVFTHELTHYIQLVHDRGFFAFLGRIFGDGARAQNGLLLPDWVTEGTAVIAETQLTNGGRGDSPLFEMIQRAMVYESVEPRYGRIGSTTQFFPPGRPYVIGYLLASYIQIHYGPDALAEIHSNYLRFPFFGPDGAIRSVTGRRGADLLVLAMKELAERFDGEMGIDAGSSVVPNEYGDYFLPILTDRGWILHRSTHDRKSALVLYNPKDNREEILVNGPFSERSSFTADKSGNTIIYAVKHAEAHAAGRIDYSELYELQVDDASTRRISNQGNLWHPALSPDGSRLVAILQKGNNSCLVEVDRATGDLELLFSIENSSVFDPAFSKDGKIIAFCVSADGMQDIWAIYSNAPTRTVDEDHSPGTFNKVAAWAVTGPDASGEYYPAFSGDTIIFSSDLSGRMELYSRHVSGTGPYTRVVEDPVGAYAGLKVGKSIVYATIRSKGYTIRAKPFPPRQEDVRPPDQPFIRVMKDSNVGNMDLSAKHYVDIPRPIWWLPVPVSFPPRENSILNRFGIGVQISSISILGRNTANAQLAFDLEFLQPQALLAVSTQVGKGTLSTQISQSFIRIAGGYAQGSQQKISYQYPIISRSIGSISTLLVPGMGLAHQIELLAPERFSYFENTPSRIIRQWLYSTANIQFARSREGGRKDLYEPLLIDGRLSITALAPIADTLSVRSAANADVLFRFPSFIKHQTIGIGIKSHYGGAGMEFLEPSIRGSFLNQNGSGMGVLIVGLEYHFHIALLDLPLPYGFSVNQIGGGIHIAKAASYNISPAIFRTGNIIYPGIEILVNFGTVTHIPVGVGVVARVDVANLSLFSVPKDLSVYMILSTRSFLDTLTPAGLANRSSF